MRFVVSGDVAGLWLAVVALGVYHGLNPAMGWPLAVARGLETKRSGAVFATLVPLGAGHLAAMALVLVPFALLSWFVQWHTAIRVGAGAAVLLFGAYKLVDRRHPRFLARVRPTQVAWWSFLMATAHGAGLMLLPVTLGLCGPPSAGAGSQLLRASAATAIAAAAVHTLAMIATGLACAWLVYRYFGLKVLSRGWLDLDAVWGASLVVAGGASAALALAQA